MKRILLPLLASLALPTTVNANVDPKVAEMCMKAVDFQGCVAAMTGKKLNEYGEGTRKITSGNNTLTSIFNPLAISAMEVEGEYGRYLKYRYFLRKEKQEHMGKQVAELDCKESKARFPSLANQGLNNWVDPTSSRVTYYVQAKNNIREFCPQMKKLVKEAKLGNMEYYQYPFNSSTNIWTEQGQIVHFNPETVTALKINDEWGRYLEWRLFIKTKLVEKRYLVDCQKSKLKPDGYKRWRKFKKVDHTLMNQSCSQMEHLVEEAKSGTKEYYQYPINGSITSNGSISGGGGWSVPNNQAEINRMRIQTNEYKQYLKDYSRDMGWE